MSLRDLRQQGQPDQRRNHRAKIAAAFILGLAAIASPARALQVFFSGSATDSRVATSPLGGTGSRIYVWMVPSANDDIIFGTSINIRVDTSLSVINFTGFSIYNPGGTRWSGTPNNGTINPSNRGVGANGIPSGYIGLYKTNTTGVVTSTPSTGIAAGPGDDGTGAYLYGTLTYSLTTSLNLPKLYLGVGGASVSGPGPVDHIGGGIFSLTADHSSSFPSQVYFGTGDASVFGDSKGAESTVADATTNLEGWNFSIPPVPEPTAIALLGIAGVSLLRRRRT